MMFGYLIVFAIAFPSGESVEVQKFNIWSSGTFDQATCALKAKETADYIAAFTNANIPDAQIQMKMRCDPRIPLPVA